MNASREQLAGNLPNFFCCAGIATLLIATLLVTGQQFLRAQGPPGQQQSGPPGPPPDQSSQPGGTSDTASGTRGEAPKPPSAVMELARISQAMSSANASLDDAQSAKILGVLQDKQTAMDSLRSPSKDRESAMKQMRSLDEAADETILAVLSKTQQKVYLSLRHRGPGSPPDPSKQSARPPDGMRHGNQEPDPGDSLIDANTGGGIRQSS